MKDVIDFGYIILLAGFVLWSLYCAANIFFAAYDMMDPVDPFGFLASLAVVLALVMLRRKSV